MTGKARAPIGPEILEERIVCGDRGDAGLKTRDTSAGIAIDFELGNDGRRRLGALVGIFEHAHFLRVVDRAGRPGSRLGGIDVADTLRQRERRRAAQKTDESKT